MKHLKKLLARWKAARAGNRARSARLALRDTVRRAERIIARQDCRRRGLRIYAGWLTERQPANVIQPGRGLAALIPSQKRRAA